MTWAAWFSSRDHLWWGPPLFECDLQRIKGTAWWSDNLLESFTLLADDRYCVAYNRGEDAKRRIFLSPHVARKIMNGEEEQSYFRWMLADVHVIHCAVNFFGELKGASESSSQWQPGPGQHWLYLEADITGHKISLFDSFRNGSKYLPYAQKFAECHVPVAPSNPFLHGHCASMFFQLNIARHRNGIWGLSAEQSYRQIGRRRP